MFQSNYNILFDLLEPEEVMHNFIIILLILQYNYSKLQKIMKPHYLKGVSYDNSKVKFVKSLKKKRWSTIPPITTKRSITSHLMIIELKKDYDIYYMLIGLFVVAFRLICESLNTCLLRLEADFLIIISLKINLFLPLPVYIYKCS